MRSVDAGLIHLVTSRYSEMQGLVTVALAMFPVILPLGFFISPNDTFFSWYCIGCVACFLASLIWLRPRIFAYYAARFGRVSSGFRYFWPILIIQALGLNPALTLYHLPLLARGLVIFLMLGAWPARVVVRDWPYRGYWVLPFVVACGAAFPLASASRDVFTTAGWWMAIGVSVAVAGAGDHLLLVRTLRPALRGEETDHA